MIHEVKLPSGAKLEVTLSPFQVSKTLYQAVLEEIGRMKLDPNADIDVNFWKEVFCIGLSSKKIEAALWECMKRATIDGTKITDDTFEPPERRDDYLTVCLEVAQLNVSPFMKSLSSQYSLVLGKLQGFLK